MRLKTVTFRVSEERLRVLDSLAELHQRDRSFVLNEALAQYLSLFDYHGALIEEGVRQLDAGHGVDHASALESVAERARKTGQR